MPLGSPCDYIVAITDHSNAAMPFVLTAFPASLTVLTNHCYYAMKSFVQHH